MSKYYIYKMTAITEDGNKGSYIGQHKIGRKCPFNDGYKGSGHDWKKHILDNHIPVEKVILRMCDTLEDANYWEDYYIESAKVQGIYLWNMRKGGGSHDHIRLYTDEEIREHYKQRYKKYNKINKEHYKQWKKTNKKNIVEYNKHYYNQLCQYNGEILTLNALRVRFKRNGIKHPITEAKKYLID